MTLKHLDVESRRTIADLGDWGASRGLHLSFNRISS